MTSNFAPAAVISLLKASTCSLGIMGSSAPVRTSTRAFTFPFSAGVFVARTPWKVTAASRSAPARTMLRTTPPPKQYPIAAIFSGSTWGSCLSCSRAALNLATSTAGSLVASFMNASASFGCVATLPLPYMSSANPTYPAWASRLAELRACSLWPHHSCTTRTPGRRPFAASSHATKPCSTVESCLYSSSRVLTAANAAEPSVSTVAVTANARLVRMRHPPGLKPVVYNNATPKATCKSCGAGAAAAFRSAPREPRDAVSLQRPTRTRAPCLDPTSRSAADARNVPAAAVDRPCVVDVRPDRRLGAPLRRRRASPVRLLDRRLGGADAGWRAGGHQPDRPDSGGLRASGELGGDERHDRHEPQRLRRGARSLAPDLGRQSRLSAPAGGNVQGRPHDPAGRRPSRRRRDDDGSHHLGGHGRRNRPSTLGAIDRRRQDVDRRLRRPVRAQALSASGRRPLEKRRTERIGDHDARPRGRDQDLILELDPLAAAALPRVHLEADHHPLAQRAGPVRLLILRIADARTLVREPCAMSHHLVTLRQEPGGQPRHPFRQVAQRDPGLERAGRPAQPVVGDPVQLALGRSRRRVAA